MDINKWINEKHLETALGYKNLVGNKTQYNSGELKKKDLKYKIVKIFAEELAIHLIIDIKIAKAAELKIKLGFNQLNPIMTKQQSVGLR